MHQITHLLGVYAHIGRQLIGKSPLSTN